MRKSMKTLSIRQPWAWLIVNGYKDIENRTWETNLRGRIYIHASKGMTQAEYDDCAALAQNLGVTLPPADQLERGGIVGAADIADCVSTSDSSWFFGPFGFRLANVKKLPFMPCRGSLGFFDAQPEP